MSEDLTQASDAALVVAIGRWRQDALAEAYRRHAGAVYGLAVRVLADRAMAEEIVQEVFLRLWDHPDRYDAERGALRALLLANGHGGSGEIVRSEEAGSAREEGENRQGGEAGEEDRQEGGEGRVGEE